MKSILIPAVLLTALNFIACKKSYTCSCTNPGGTEKVFTTHSSKTKANEKCKQYYEDHWGDIPWSETYCSIEN